MADMAASNRWAGDIGIFEYETADHGTYDDDDWKDGDSGKGFGGEYVALDLYVDGTDSLETLVVVSYGIVEDPDIKVSKFAARKNFKMGIGAAQATITFKVLCIDDATDSAEDKANRIIGFCRRHKKMTDNDIYLIMRRDVAGTYEYWEWEDDSGNYDRKWLQVSVTSGKPKHISYGVIEIAIQCEEVNT